MAEQPYAGCSCSWKLAELPAASPPGNQTHAAVRGGFLCEIAAGGHFWQGGGALSSVPVPRQASLSALAGARCCRLRCHGSLPLPRCPLPMATAQGAVFTSWQTPALGSPPEMLHIREPWLSRCCFPSHPLHRRIASIQTQLLSVWNYLSVLHSCTLVLCTSCFLSP